MHLRLENDIVVCERSPLRASMQRKLHEIDPKLFLEKYVRPRDQAEVWRVCYDQGFDREPLVLFDWADPDSGRPLDLSWSLFDRVVTNRLDRSPRRELAMDAAQKANDAWQEERSDFSQREQDRVCEEILPLMHPIHSAVLHRGVHLRMSRDKARARGEKV
jgi:hypothetical protein